MTEIKNFVIFVVKCWENMIHYYVGGTFQSKESDVLAKIGILGGGIGLLCFFVLVKFFCLDYEGYEKKDGLIRCSVVVSVILMFLFYLVIYLIKYPK